MSEYHLKFIKYILSSSKEWTGVGLLNYRDVYLLSASISRENIEIILSVESVPKSDTTTKTNNCKRASSDAGILGIREDTRCRLWIMPIIGDRQDIFILVTHGGILF